MKPDFDDYKGLTKEDILISPSKHSITGFSPWIAGHYYYIVDARYVSKEGDTQYKFETTLELVVKGLESDFNHNIHEQNGYFHGLNDHFNQNETTDFIKFFAVLIIVFLAFFGLAACLRL